MNYNCHWFLTANLKKFYSGMIMFFILLLLQACTKHPDSFLHTVKNGPTPWTYEPESRMDEKFTFAIIGDLHSGEREGVFSIAVEQLNLLRPEFVLSVGDLVDGGTEDTVELKNQFDHFDERAAKLKSPFFHVVGNHDITNAAMRQYWEKRYGKRYYHFVYNNVLFLVLDSEDYSEERMRQIYEARAKAIEVLDGPNPELARQLDYFKMPERASGEIGDDQSSYFEKVIEEHPNVRWTFLLMHKPVWKREAEGNLSRLEKALDKRKYTVINGHFHDYSHTLRNDQDYIMVATTSGGQNPLSETAFDHLTLITMDQEGPVIANLRMDGILNKYAHIPLNGDTLCFQASKCRE